MDRAEQLTLLMASAMTDQNKIKTVLVNILIQAGFISADENPTESDLLRFAEDYLKKLREQK